MKMRKFLQNKLWRDKLPEKMEQMGSKIHVKQLDDEAFSKALRNKLCEEADEVQSAQTKEELIHELADVFEVIDALCVVYAISNEELKDIQSKKRQERGGFAGRTFVTIAEHAEGSSGEKYCRAQPEKYPEIID